MLKEELRIRENEANNFVKYIAFLESDNPYSDTDEKDFNEMLILTNLKASVVILVYNAVESTITKCLTTIHNELKRKEIFYDQCSDRIKNLVITYYKYAEMKCETFHKSIEYYREGMDFSQGKIPFLLSYEKMSQFYPLYSGNLDSRVINNVLKKYGIEFEERISVLKTIKDKRNALAHGEYSFEEVGRDISRQQINDMVTKTFNYLGKVIDSVEEYLEKQLYLKNNATIV